MDKKIKPERRGGARVGAGRKPHARGGIQVSLYLPLDVVEILKAAPNKSQLIARLLREHNDNTHV